MVQILNKMVHLKYPNLEICADVWLINILPNINCLLQGWNLIQSWGKCSKTIWQHSSTQGILTGKLLILHPILSVCSCQSIKCKHLKLRFSATFGTCYSSQMPSLRLKSEILKSWGIYMSPSTFVSTALDKSLQLLQTKYIEYCI
jgi:hypothetical protein